MKNIEKIIFDTKYNIKYMNNSYVISGFDHVKNIIVLEEDILDFLDNEELIYFDREDWLEFVNNYEKERRL